MTETTIQDKPTVVIDLTELPQGQSYEDRYQGYLKVFERIASIPPDQNVVVKSPPYSWAPLLYHLNCTMFSPRVVFEHCQVVEGAMFYNKYEPDRTAVEVLCGVSSRDVRRIVEDRRWAIFNAACPKIS